MSIQNEKLNNSSCNFREFPTKPMELYPRRPQLGWIPGIQQYKVQVHKVGPRLPALHAEEDAPPQAETNGPSAGSENLLLQPPRQILPKLQQHSTEAAGERVQERVVKIRLKGRQIF